MGLGVGLWLACSGELFLLNYLVRMRALTLGILINTKPLQKYKNRLTSFSLSFHFSKLPKSLTPNPILIRFF